MNDISKRIVQLRKSKGYGQKEFASIIGVSHVSLSKFENLKTDIISLGVAKKIAKELGISFIELFEIEDSETGSSELTNEIAEKESEIEKLKSTLNDKVIMVEMYKNEKTRISKDILHFLEETHDTQIYYLNKNSSLSKFQKKEIQNTIFGMMNTIAASYFAVTGLITESDLDKIIPKHKGIVRPADPED